LASGYKWKRLQRAAPLPPNEALIAGVMRHLACDREEALKNIALENNDEVWLNDLYQVVIHRQQGMIHLNIRRVDGYPGRDWRHFQQIKNELVGEEYEAVELYPAESRKADTANKYHLWVINDPSFRFPFGFTERQVCDEESDVPGLRQAPPMQFRKERDGDGRK